jgi:hypothetical protein
MEYRSRCNIFLVHLEMLYLEISANIAFLFLQRNLREIFDTIL